MVPSPIFCCIGEQSPPPITLPSWTHLHYRIVETFIFLPVLKKIQKLASSERQHLRPLFSYSLIKSCHLLPFKFYWVQTRSGSWHFHETCPDSHWLLSNQPWRRLSSSIISHRISHRISSHLSSRISHHISRRIAHRNLRKSELPIWSIQPQAEEPTPGVNNLEQSIIISCQSCIQNKRISWHHPNYLRSAPMNCVRNRWIPIFPMRKGKEFVRFSLVSLST